MKIKNNLKKLKILPNTQSRIIEAKTARINDPGSF